MGIMQNIAINGSYRSLIPNFISNFGEHNGELKIPEKCQNLIFWSKIIQMLRKFTSEGFWVSDFKFDIRF